MEGQVGATGSAGHSPPIADSKTECTPPIANRPRLRKQPPRHLSSPMMRREDHAGWDRRFPTIAHPQIKSALVRRTGRSSHHRVIQAGPCVCPDAAADLPRRRLIRSTEPPNHGREWLCCQPPMRMDRPCLVALNQRVHDSSLRAPITIRPLTAQRLVKAGRKTH